MRIRRRLGRARAGRSAAPYWAGDRVRAERVGGPGPRRCSTRLGRRVRRRRCSTATSTPTTTGRSSPSPGPAAGTPWRPWPTSPSPSAAASTSATTPACTPASGCSTWCPFVALDEPFLDAVDAAYAFAAWIEHRARRAGVLLRRVRRGLPVSLPRGAPRRLHPAGARPGAARAPPPPRRRGRGRPPAARRRELLARLRRPRPRPRGRRRGARARRRPPRGAGPRPRPGAPGRRPRCR